LFYHKERKGFFAKSLKGPGAQSTGTLCFAASVALRSFSLFDRKDQRRKPQALPAAEHKRLFISPHSHRVHNRKSQAQAGEKYMRQQADSGTISTRKETPIDQTQ
jgi:hypothetical protein